MALAAMTLRAKERIGGLPRGVEAGHRRSLRWAMESEAVSCRGAVAILAAISILTVGAPGGSSARVAHARVAQPLASRSRNIAELPVTVTTRLIVQPAIGMGIGQVADRSADVVGSAATVVGRLSDRFWTIEFEAMLSPAEAGRLADHLIEVGLVLSAEPEARRSLASVVTAADPLIGDQWGLADPLQAGGQHGIAIDRAWAVSTGNPAAVIAIVDTGSLPHPDFGSRIVPGFDMISVEGAARDGDGRDRDATDEGDWCNAPSSWHGLHVAGIAAAESDNGIGIAGVDRLARVQHVRALGACTGTVVDEADAIRWAAGLPVIGAPLNPTPARVVNVSLGGFGECSIYEQAAIDAATAAGSVVVVAAGNAGVDLDLAPYAPATCTNVITVAASTRSGSRSDFSNDGSMIDVWAPGGDGTSTAGAGILSTGNAGTTTADVSDGGWTYIEKSGTSMAAPFVSGVVSLMLAANPTLTLPEIERILRQTARPLTGVAGGQLTCRQPGAAACEAGLLDAGAAVRAALLTPRPLLQAATATAVAQRGP